MFSFQLIYLVLLLTSHSAQAKFQQKMIFFIVKSTFLSGFTSCQVGRVCVENCLQFDGFSVSYQLEVPDNTSADWSFCSSAVSVIQSLDGVQGVLYVNNSEALRKCADLQYVVVAQEGQAQLEASTQIHIVLEGEGITWTHL